MPRATKAHKARLLNAAYRLLGQRIGTAEAARQLADEFALSRRQAYRYLEQAAALSAPVPVDGTDRGHHSQTPGESRARGPRVRTAQRAHPWANRHPGAGRVSRRRHRRRG